MLGAHTRTRLVAAITLGLALAVAGCDDGDGDDDLGQGQAALRVVHASPDAPAVDIYAAGDTTPLITNLAYGQTSDYLELDAASYTLEIRKAGDPASSAPVHTTPALTLGDQTRTTAVAAGLVGSTVEDERFRVLAFQETFAAPTNGNARVRVIHAAPRAPAVGIDVGADGSVEVATLERYAGTTAEGIALPAGQALQLRVVSNGQPVASFTTPNLPDGGEIFLIASGLLDQAPRLEKAFSLLGTTRTADLDRIKQNPTLYVLHGSPDAPAVDVFAGNLQLADDLTFAEVSTPVQVPPGTYTVDLFPHEAGQNRPAGAPLASQATGGLEAGEQYLAIASGFAGPGKATPLSIEVYQEEFDLSTPDQARLRVIHASPDTDAVDVGPIQNGAVSPLPDAAGVDFAEATPPPGAALPPGPVAIGAAGAGNTLPVASFPIAPEGGDRDFAVVVGTTTPESGEQPLELVVIDTSTIPWTANRVPNQQAGP